MSKSDYDDFYVLEARIKTLEDAFRHKYVRDEIASATGNSWAFACKQCDLDKNDQIHKVQE